MLVITNEIKNYILSVLLRDTSYIGIISYSDNIDLQTPVTIIPSEFFKVNFYATEKSIPTFPLQEWEGIPLLYGHPEVKIHNGRLIIYADIIASSFFLMSRYEEIIRPDNIDVHGRFIGSASIAGQGQFLDRPIIDEYGKKLREYLRKIGILINEPSAKGMVYLTHDIDLPWQRLSFIAAIRKTAAEIVKEHQWHIYPLLNSLNCFLINPYDTFSWLQQQDSSVKRQLGERCKDIYFIIGNLQKSSKTNSYLMDEKADDLIRKISSASAIGLHLSYEAGRENDYNKLREEKYFLEERLGKGVTCNRNHYLLSHGLESFRNLIKVGITDDFTMGYADQVGFRLGTAQCIYWIDPEMMELTTLRLHSLNVMDNTLCEPQYLGLNEDESFKKTEIVYASAQAVNGDFCILLHNSMIVPGRYYWLKDWYARIISMVINDESEE